MTPAQITLRAKLAAHASWAATADPSARTAPARAAFNDRFARAVDPDGTMPTAERARRAEQARRAYFLALSLKASRARSALREVS